MAYKIKIQFRRDTAANWELNKHVVPLEGEPCFETDTGVFKIGDGVTAYGDLAAIGVGLNEDAEAIQQYIKQLEILQTEFETVKETVNTIGNIPTATNDTLGLVKGGSEIFIKEDGSLEVNAISFSKILQGEDAIVFDGGSSEN